MVTKVGRANTMLICSDCGHPHTEKTRRKWSRLQGFATGIFLAALLGVTFAVARVSRTPTVAEPEVTTQAE